MRLAVDGTTYSLIRDVFHTNVAFLFGEQERLRPERDRSTLARGVAGSYPNFVFVVVPGEVPVFVDALLAVATTPRTRRGGRALGRASQQPALLGRDGRALRGAASRRSDRGRSLRPEPLQEHVTASEARSEAQAKRAARRSRAKSNGGLLGRNGAARVFWIGLLTGSGPARAGSDAQLARRHEDLAQEDQQRADQREHGRDEGEARRPGAMSSPRKAPTKSSAITAQISSAEMVASADRAVDQARAPRERAELALGLGALALARVAEHRLEHARAVDDAREPVASARRGRRPRRSAGRPARSRAG